MNVFIFWNKKDNDSKKIFHFLKSGSWINDVKEQHDIATAFIFKKFNVETGIIDSYGGGKETVSEAIEKADVLMFFTHGDEDRIFKSKCYNPGAIEEFTFVDCNTADMIKGKPVIALCCSSAKTLGPHCVGVENAPYYIGFMEAIVYDDTTQPNEKLRSIVYDAYSKGFDEGLEAALKGKYTAGKFASRLKHYLKNSIREGVLAFSERNLGSYTVMPNLYMNGIDSLVCIGDNNHMVF